MKQQANTQWIGEALMKKPHSQMTFSNKQFLYKEVWQFILFLIIVDGMKFTKDWVKIFKEMKKSKVKQLNVDNNNDPLILKHLTKVTFTHLKQLDISQNKIVSLELLSFVSFKTIIQIRIDKNNITNLKPLRKIVIENDLLSYIDVSNNFITCYQDLCHINSLALGKIVISWHNEEAYGQNVLMELMKLPLLGLHIKHIQDKRYQKLMFPEHLIMKMRLTPEITRQNDKIKARNEKYIRMQSRGQILNTKAQKLIMHKLGNKQKDPRGIDILNNRRDQNKFLLKIFNAQSQEQNII